MLDLEPIKTRARAPQAAEFLVNAVDDIDALVEEVERLRLTLRTVVVGELRYVGETERWVAILVDDRGQLLRGYFDRVLDGEYLDQLDWLAKNEAVAQVGATMDEAVQNLVRRANNA
jgi:hypothetical protein